MGVDISRFCHGGLGSAEKSEDTTLIELCCFAGESSLPQRHELD